MGLISLEQICLGVCDEAGDTSHKHLAKFMRYGTRGAKDLFMYVTPYWKELVVTSQILPIGDNFMIELPEDYLYWIKVGICSGGRIAVLGINEDLCGTDVSSNNCPCTPEATTEVNDILCGTCSGNSYTFYDTYRGGQNLGEFYGLRGGHNCLGYFREDKANNRIILSSELNGQEVIIEYKADPTFKGIANVPTEMSIAITEWVHWRNELKSRPRVSQMHRAEYIVEYDRLKKFYSSYTEREWRDMFLQANTSTIKR